jgi:DNA-binding MarR family transcriptional regulator
MAINVPTTKDSATKEAAEQLLDLQALLTRFVRAAMIDAADPEERLSNTHIRAMRLLTSGVRYPSEIAKRLDITPASASELVDTLVKRGLVERHADPGDRRCSRLLLTESGAARYQAARDRAIESLTEMLDNMDHPAIARLRDDLESLLPLLETPTTEGAK